MFIKMNYLSVRNIIMFILLAGIIVLWIFSGIIAESTFSFVETNLSPDSYMRSGTEGLQVIVQSYAGVLLVFWILLIILLFTEIGVRLQCIFFPERVKVFFLGDISKANVLKRYYQKLFFTSVLLGIPITLLSFFNHSPVVQELLKEDGIFEYSTFFLLLISSVMLLAAYFLSRKIQPNNRILSYVFVLFSIFLLLVAFEEISWGQRIFGWETSEELMKYNDQNEINIHNMFNLFFPFIYPVAAILIFLLCLLGWIPRRKYRTDKFKLFFPHPSLFPFVLYALISLLAGDKEVFEVFIYFFFFFYSLNMYLILFYKRVDLSRALGLN